MRKKADRKIILEDGQEYYGYSFGSENEKMLEIVFNTSMVGYQEILSDPSYTDQAVVMTYPLIGSYGMTAEDYETITPTIGALIVREYNDDPSNFRSVDTLGEVMDQYGIAGISGVDTRKLNRSIRDFGSRKALLTAADTPLEKGLEMLKSWQYPTDSVSRVSCRRIRRVSAQAARFHVVAIDCGMKQNIVRSLVKKSCRVTIVPWNTSAEEILALHPDGVFIFILPPSMAELRKRITGRGTETQEAIDYRLSQALSEIAYIDKYDYAVVNGKLDEAVDRVKAIIKAEHSKVTENIYQLIEQYKED